MGSSSVILCAGWTHWRSFTKRSSSTTTGCLVEGSFFSFGVVGMVEVRELLATCGIA